MTGAAGHPQSLGEDGQPQPAGATRTPYVGLVPYREEDAHFFFGREQETRIVAGNLRASRLTIVYGESGVGKSSLLQAGVIRDLHERVLANLQTPSERAPFAICSFSAWRDDPLRALVDRIWQAAVEATGDAQLPAWQAGQPLLKAVQGWTTRVRTLLVVLDQFEDYFLYHADDFLPRPDAEAGEQLAEAATDEDDPRTFADAFPRIVNDVNLRVHFILAIREDSWAKLDRFEERIPRLFESYLRIEHLDVEAARQAIEGPIEEWNRRMPPGTPPYTVEPALVDAVIAAAATGRVSSPGRGDQVADRAGADSIEAPFLQLVMNRLWVATVQAGSRELTSAQLRALGGAQRIVENHLHDALRSLTRREQGTAADAFRYLVTRTNTKIAHPASDLADWTKRPEPEVTAVLEKLCRGEGGRILRQVHPPGGGETRYELFHDVLAEPILDWRRTYEQRRARRRALGIGTVLLAVVAVFAGLAIWALAQRQHARTEATDARSLALATDANSASGVSPSAALVLSLAALAPYRAGPSSPTSALATTIHSLHTAESQGLTGILQGTTTPVNSVAFSPDGRTLATGTADGTVLLWNTANRTLIASLSAGSGNHVNGVAFSPDGRTLAAGTSRGTVLLWDTANRTRVASLPAGTGLSVSAVAFSPDGRTLAAGAGTRLTPFGGGTVVLWDTANHTHPALLSTGSSGPVSAVAFSPHGHTLAAGTYGGAVLRWDTANRTRLAPLQAGSDNPVYSVAFSPDGRTLASGTNDGTLLWDTANRTRLATISAGKRNAVLTVAFTPDGRTLAAGTYLGAVVLWDTVNRTRLASLSAGSDNHVNGVAFSPDGRTLAAGTSRGTVLLWNTANRTRVASLSASSGTSVQSVALSPDGRRLAAGTRGGTVVLWNTADLSKAATLPSGSRNPVYALAFSPNGRTLAAGTYHGTVLLWNTANHTKPASLSTGAKLIHDADNFVNSVAFSPDGRTLAAGTDLGAVVLWNTATHKQLGTLSVGANNPVYSVALSPDGRTLAAGTSRGTVLVWNTANNTKPVSLAAGANNAVLAVAFSPDGDTLAAGTSGRTVLIWNTADLTKPASLSAGSGKNPVLALAFSLDGGALAAYTLDGTMLLWDTADRTLLASLPAGNSTGRAVAFSPDGNTLAAGANGGTVRLSPVLSRNFGALRDEICGLVPDGLTRAVWRTYAPGLPYEDDCH